jgi:hypothetical protein
MEKYGRKNNGGNGQRLHDPDLVGCPHIEEILIGGNVYLDLLSFPSKRFKKHGRNGEKQEATQGKIWMREKGAENSPWGQRMPFIAFQQHMAVVSSGDQRFLCSLP